MSLKINKNPITYSCRPRRQIQPLKRQAAAPSVIVNNPCLEFWLLLHYETTVKFFDTCASAEKQLKPYLTDALNNAKNLGLFQTEEPYNAMAEMPLFFETEAFGELFKRHSS